MTIDDELFDPELFEPRLNAFIPHAPTPRQAAFLMFDCQEAFYGGAGGDGKSDALLMAALQYADVPGYNALIIRRNITDLAMPNALMDRAHAWLGRRNDAHWDESKKRWSFASGATLSFGHLEGARDGDRYASAEFHFVAFDELTQFSEKQYLDLFAQPRAPACPRCKFEKQYRTHRDMVHRQHTTTCLVCVDLARQQLSAARDSFSHLPEAHIPCACARRRTPATSVTIGSSADLSRGSELPSATACLCRRASTTTHISSANSTYRSLLNLDPVTRARILKGDWEARSMRGVIKREWFEIVDALPADLAMIRYWDTAFQKKRTSDYTVGVKYGIGRNGIGFIVHVARTKASPHEVERFIANAASQDSRNIRVVLQQEPGSGSALWIDSMRRGALLGYPVYADQVKGTKFERSQPFRAAAEAGNIRLLRGPWNEAFLEECEQFSPDEHEYAHDDQIDASCGAFNYLTAPPKYEYIPVPKESWDERHSRDDDRPYFPSNRRFPWRGCW